jgi:hypothetical protein
VCLEDFDDALNSSDVIQSECRFLVCNLFPKIYFLKVAYFIIFDFKFRRTSCGGEKIETIIHECVCSYFNVAGIQHWKFVDKVMVVGSYNC